MYGRSQTAQTYNIVFTFVLICLNWNCSIQCGTNIVFLNEDFNYIVSSGSLLHIQCFLRFSQSVTISFDSEALVSKSERFGSQTKYNYHSNIQANGTLHVLTIQHVEESDNGRYICASDGDDETIKQMTITVTYIPEGARCTMSVQQVVINNDSGRLSYQFHCSTLGYPNANISAFLNGQIVDKQANLTVRGAGNDSESTLSFSSNLDYLSSNPLFYCNLTDENYSPCIHEGICYHSSPITSTNYWAYFNGTVTATYQQNSTTLSVTAQTNGYGNLNFVIVIVVSLLVTSLLLIFIGIKFFHQLKIALTATFGNKKSRRHETELSDVVDETVECVEPATRKRNNVPHNVIDSSTSNEGYVEGMVMVKNELYESSKEDLLTCVPMVKNDIYESVAADTTYEVESQMYSIIQRNQSCFDT